MNQYDALDAEILDAIDKGVRTFTAIHNRVEALTKPHSLRNHFRVTDRRLQALRKRGLVRFRDKEWHIGSDISPESPATNSCNQKQQTLAKRGGNDG